MPVWFLLVMVSLAFTTTDIFELCASCYQVRMECFFTTKFAIFTRIQMVLHCVVTRLARKSEILN